MHHSRTRCFTAKRNAARLLLISWVYVTPELARAAIASVTVLGALHASPEVRAALADRMS